MSNIEKIKAEIERRIENYWSDGDVDSVVVSGELEELIDFIDSLPEEKPSDDLEEAAEMAARKNYPYEGGMKGLICENSTPIYKAGFIAGAKWMRKKDVEDMYMSDNRHFLKCYEQGKVDMKVEMMKDAMDGEIVKDITNMLAVTAKNINLDGFKFGDKVKIIIIKDND